MQHRQWCKQKRYYCAEIRRDLFCDQVRVLSWGRIGWRPTRVVVRPFGSPAEAETALRAVHERRVRRGYVLTSEVLR